MASRNNYSTVSKSCWLLIIAVICGLNLFVEIATAQTPTSGGASAETAEHKASQKTAAEIVSAHEAAVLEAQVKATVAAEGGTRAAEKQAEIANEQLRYTYWQTWITGFSAAVGLVGLFFLYGSLKLTRAAIEETQKAVAATRDEIAHANPPRLRVLYFIVHRSGDGFETPLVFQKGDEIEGQAWVINDGSGTAAIEEAHCGLYWLKGDKLPMAPPYSSITPADKNKPEKYPHTENGIETEFKRDTSFETGARGRWKMISTVPDYHKTAKLYIMGYIFYKDKLENKRYFTFARQYDERNQRFIKLNDSDYDNEF